MSSSIKHKKCINKEKTISFLIEYYDTFKNCKKEWSQTKMDTYAYIIEKIESGELDNE